MMRSDSEIAKEEEELAENRRAMAAEFAALGEPAERQDDFGDPDNDDDYQGACILS